MVSTAKLLGTNLKRLRELRGWTQAELAERCDIANTMIQKIEYAQTNPSAKTIDALCRVLDVDPVELFKGKREPLPTFGSAADFLSKFEDLPPLLKTLVLGLVYQDAGYARGVKLDADAQLVIQKLFGLVPKAR